MSFRPQFNEGARFEGGPRSRSPFSAANTLEKWLFIENDTYLRLHIYDLRSAQTKTNPKNDYPTKKRTKTDILARNRILECGTNFKEPMRDVCLIK